MQQILMMVGVSGSGKSTFARQFVLDHPDYLRIGRDELRRSLLPVSLGEYWQWDTDRKDRIERLVTALEKTALLTALDDGWNVVLDNTHLHRRYITDLRKLVSSRTLTIQCQLIDITPDEAIQRDQTRPDTVGEAVIRAQFARLETLKKQVDLTKTVLLSLP